MSDPIFQIKIENPLDKQKVSDGVGLVRAMMRAMATENALTLAHIEEAYESFPSDQPTTMDGLRTISGLLRRSNTVSAPSFIGGGIQSTFGNPVEYAAIQEFGGQTRAHDIVARNAKALAFTPGGKFFSAADFNEKLRGTRGNYRALKTDLFVKENGIVFRRMVHHPGSDIPARQPIQRAIEDRLPQYAVSMERAATDFLNN